MNHTAWMLGVTAGLAACGGTVVDLEADAHPAGGHAAEIGTAKRGGAATTGSSGSGSAGDGPGSEPPACRTLTQTGWLTPLPGISGAIPYPKKMIALAGGETAVVHELVVPGLLTKHLATHNLAWTGAWPPPQAAPVMLVKGYLASPGVMVAPAPAKPDAIAVFGSTDPYAAGSQLGLADAKTGAFTPILWDSTAKPSFLATDASGLFFFGLSTPTTDDGAGDFDVAWTSATPFGLLGPQHLGCVADSPYSPLRRAQAVAVPGGWLLAHAIRDQNCSGPNGSVVVTRIDATQPATTATLPAEPAAPVDLVRSPSGAWLVYGEGAAGMVAVRLADDGHVLSAPIALFPGSDLLVTDTLDGGLLVAASDHDSAGLTLAVIDAQGHELASTFMKLPWRATSAAIAFDAASRQILVAVGLPGPIPTKPLDFYGVARFSCS